MKKDGEAKNKQIIGYCGKLNHGCFKLIDLLTLAPSFLVCVPISPLLCLTDSREEVLVTWWLMGTDCIDSQQNRIIHIF